MNLIRLLWSFLTESGDWLEMLERNRHVLDSTYEHVNDRNKNRTMWG